ncbi:MAG: hypothetical protein NWR44_01770, partial [Alphaproteobacteria bacterium]|nr:hypothetical protein [Alphaproteobacteria bacterium]
MPFTKSTVLAQGWGEKALRFTIGYAGLKLDKRFGVKRMPLDQQTFAKCKIVKATANRGHQPSPFPEFEDNLNSHNMDKAYA